MTQPTEPRGSTVVTPRHYHRGPVHMLLLAALIVLVDQLTKVWAVSQLEGRPPVDVIGDTVQLVLLRNPGAAFSFGTDSTVVFAVLSTVVVLGLLWYSRSVYSRWWAWGMGLVLGGAAGNLADRLLRDPGVLRGHVVDFLSVGWWPVFNVADSCLVAGVVVIMVAVVIGEDQSGRRAGDTDRDTDSGEVTHG